MKGKEIFTEDHSERLAKTRIGKPYRPSNGTEGELFMDHYCHHCVFDTENIACDLIVLSMFYDPKDEEYPKEWIYDTDGQPTCTKFKEKE